MILLQQHTHQSSGSSLPCTRTLLTLVTVMVMVMVMVMVTITIVIIAIPAMYIQCGGQIITAGQTAKHIFKSSFLNK